MSFPCWVFDLDCDGAEPAKGQLRIEDEYVIIRIGGSRGEDIKIKATHLTEALNEHKATLV